MRVMFLDTETPGFKKPLVPVEAAGFFVNSPLVKHTAQEGLETFEHRYKLSVGMEYGAVATHHILPHELNGRPEWNKTTFQSYYASVSYLVGYNVDFDAEVTGAPNALRKIDVLALSRLWVPDLDSHKLGAMMYYVFGLTEQTRDALRNAHSALADIQMTGALLVQMAARFAPEVRNWDELYEQSEKGRIPIRFGFGKYAGKDGKPGLLIREFIREMPANADYRSYHSWLKRTEPYKSDIYLNKALDWRPERS